MNAKLEKDQAVQKFLAGYNCAQAVLYSACPRLQLERDLALKLSTGFGAGIARLGNVCGAVSGGVLALGLRYGRGENDEKTKTNDTYNRIQVFMDAFEKARGSVKCADLVKCDLNTPEGQQYFKDHDLLHRTCVGCVETAIALLEQELERA